MAGRRSVLPALAALLALAAVAQLSFGTNFVAPPSARAASQVQNNVAAAGVTAGLFLAEPAYANVWDDEIFPYSVTISFAIIWGIILGFVLLRLQEDRAVQHRETAVDLLREDLDAPARRALMDVSVYIDLSETRSLGGSPEAFSPDPDEDGQTKRDASVDVCGETRDRAGEPLNDVLAWLNVADLDEDDPHSAFFLPHTGDPAEQGENVAPFRRRPRRKSSNYCDGEHEAAPVGESADPEEEEAPQSGLAGDVYRKSPQQLSKVSYKNGDRPWEDFTLRGSRGPVLTHCVVLQPKKEMNSWGVTAGMSKHVYYSPGLECGRCQELVAKSEWCCAMMRIACASLEEAVRGESWPAEHGRAVQAGIKSGDLLVSINGKKDFAGLSASEILQRMRGGVTLVFLGFIGKWHAEVYEEIVFQPTTAPLLLAVPPEPGSCRPKLTLPQGDMGEVDEVDDSKDEAAASSQSSSQPSLQDVASDATPEDVMDTESCHVSIGHGSQ
eukprot:s2200_g9.t1